MHITNTKTTYGSIAKYFHWVTAAGVLISYCSIYYREWFAQSDFENYIAIQLHFSIGISLCGIVLLRLLWRALNESPSRELPSLLQDLALKLVHFTLYALMIIMPLSGYFSIANYLSSGKGTVSYFFIVDLTIFEGVNTEKLLGISLLQLEDISELIHSVLGAFVLWLLILGHSLAALYHHFVKQDNTLRKMTCLKQKPHKGNRDE